MRKITLALSLLAVLVGFAADAALADEEAVELRVYRAKARFKEASGPRDTLLLKAVFPIGLVPNTYDVGRDGFTVTIGGQTVISLPPVDSRARLHRKFGLGWSYRERKSSARVGVRKLKLEPGAGKIALKLKRADLAGLAAEGPVGVTVTMVMGDVVYEDEIDFSETGRGWTYTGDGGIVFTPSPPVGGGGGGGGGGGDPLPLTFTELLSGSYSTIQVARTFVVKNAQEYSIFWSQHSPPMPPGVGAPDVAPPFVDFSKHMVVGVFLGPRNTGGYSVKITSVEALGNGAKVSYEESQPGPNCVVTQAITYPFVIAIVTRVDGPVTFSGKVTVVNCP